MVIEGYLKKRKENSVFGGMFSNYNKRWFVLDLNKGEFKYKNKPGSKQNKINITIQVLSCESAHFFNYLFI